MAQTIKLKRSASQGAAPSTSNLELGEVAINTYDGKMYIKKDVGGTESIVEIGGGSTVSYLEAGMIEYEYTATSNQTTFSGSDTNSATLSYTANSIMVFLNGVLQDDGVDYTATNGTSVVFTSALTANDEVRIVAFTNVTTSGSLQDPTKLDAITTVNAQAAYSLTLDSSAYVPSSQNALIVSLNGITQEPGDSFTISGSTITFSPALVTGDVVDYIVDMGRAVTIGEYSGDLAVGGELEVTGDIIGDLRGAILFKAQAGETLAKGDVVYISGISGNTTVVSKADADDSAKMPAFGLVAAAASSGNPVDVYTFGTLSGLDTSSFSEGDELFVSTTAGTLTNSAPTGESSKLQKIAKVTRSHNSSGSIKIMGAGRSNATPNLNDGNIFIGNASNQAVTASLNTKIEDYLDGGTSTPVFSTINSGNITTTGYIAGPSTFTIDPAAVGDNTGTLVVAGNLQVDGTTTTINSTTMTVDDLNITLASGAANAAAANGAGITVDGASATLTYNGTNDDWNFNKDLNVSGNLTSTGTITSGDITISESTPFLRIQDTDGTNTYTHFTNINGNTYFGSRNDTDDGNILIGGYGGNSFTEFARWSAAGIFTQKYDLTVQGAFTSLGIDDNASSTAITISSAGATTFSGDVNLEESTPRLQFQDTDITDSLFQFAQAGGTMYVRSRGGTSSYGDVRFQRNNDGSTHLDVFRTTTGGDVVFYDVDGSTEGMRWDSSVNRVGIGIGAPAKTIDMQSTAPAVRFRDTSATTTITDLLTSGTNGHLFNMVLDADNAGTSPSFLIKNYTTEIFRFTGTGRLGIGEPAPDEELHIKASVPTIKLEDGDGTNQFVRIFENSGQASVIARNNTSFGNTIFRREDGTNIYSILNLTANGDVDFYDDIGSSVGMRWDASAERLGIGDTTPASLLQVGSDTNANADAYITFGKRVASTETNLPFIGQDDPDGGGHSDLGIGARSNNGTINFYTGNDQPFAASNIRMTIAANGKVTIGADSQDTHELSVREATSPRITIDDTNGTSTNVNAGLLLRYDTTNAASFSYTNNADLAVTNYLAGDIIYETGAEHSFTVGGVEEFRITNTETSVFGTSGDIFTLVDTNLTASAGNIGNVRIAFDDSAGTRVAYVGTANSGDFFVNNTYGSVKLTSAGSTKLTTISAGINVTGSIGVNTTPARNLHVNSGSAQVTALFQSTGAGTYVDFANSTTAQGRSRIGAEGTDTLVFKTEGAERLRILAGGGLTFNGDTAAANALDDYEEGAFNVAFAGVTGTSYNQQNTYVKVGNTVTVHIRVFMSSQPTSITAGDLEITGLPFSAGEDAVGSVMAYRTEAGSDNSNVIAIIAANTSSIKFTHNGFDNITNYTLFQNSVLDSAFGSNRNVFIITLSYNLIAG